MSVTVSFEVDRTQEFSPVELEFLRLLASRLGGHDLAAIDAPDVVVDRMEAAIPDATSAWADILGPAYTTGRVCKFLGVTRQAVSQQVKARAMLRVVTSDKVALFPSFQFDRHGNRVPGLKQVLDTLSLAYDDPWTWVWWLNTPVEGRTMVQDLWAGELEDVLAEAKADVASWTH
jgi:hypothetical protein